MIVLIYLATIGLVVLTVAMAMARPLAGTGFQRWLMLGLVLSVVRVGALWFLQYHEWNRSASLSFLPLVFLLVPEAFLAQRLLTLGAAASVGGVIAFSMMLAVGSFLLSTAVFGAAWLLRRALAGVRKGRGSGKSS
jgi:hypothetical protein